MSGGPRKQVTAKELAERNRISKLPDPPTPQPQRWVMDEEPANTPVANTDGPIRRSTRSTTVVAPAVGTAPSTVSDHIYLHNAFLLKLKNSNQNKAVKPTDGNKKKGGQKAKKPGRRAKGAQEEEEVSISVGHRSTTDPLVVMHGRSAQPA
jgi:hypothetical protein